MGRKRQNRRKHAEERWPKLFQLLGCHFNQDYNIMYGSLAGAFAAAARDGSLDYRRAVLKEWRDWNATEGTIDDIRPLLSDGFGVALYFAQPIAARKFMNSIYDSVIEAVKVETRRE